MISGKLLTVPQFADTFQIPVPRAYSLIRKGMVPGVVRIGRQVRVDSQKLDEFIESGGKGLADLGHPTPGPGDQSDKVTRP